MAIFMSLKQLNFNIMFDQRTLIRLFFEFIILHMNISKLISFHFMNNTVLFSVQLLREISRSHFIFLNNRSFHNRSFRSLHRIPLLYSHNRYNRYSPHHCHKSFLRLNLKKISFRFQRTFFFQ